MIVIKRTEDSNYIIFEARDKNEVLGKTVSAIENGVLNVLSLDGEAFIFDGLLRAVLNCGEKERAKTALFRCGYEKELEKLGFFNGMDIKSFFENKKCKNSL